MLRRAFLFTPLALLVIPLGTLGDDKKSDQKPFDDAEFVKMAGSGGIHEVELGKLASTKATNDAVKKFAEKIVADHTKANEDLKTAAKEANLTVPDKMNEEHQKEFDKFKNAGAAFDKMYAEHMVKDHEEDVALFTRASKEAKNPAIKAFATKTLPVIQGHLEMAKKLPRD